MSDARRAAKAAMLPFRDGPHLTTKVTAEEVWNLAVAMDALLAEQGAGGALHFVFTDFPGPKDECVFVECEDDTGRSINAGEWGRRADGLVELVVSRPPRAPLAPPPAPREYGPCPGYREGESHAGCDLCGGFGTLPILRDEDLAPPPAPEAACQKCGRNHSDESKWDWVPTCPAPSDAAVREAAEAVAAFDSSMRAPVLVRGVMALNCVDALRALLSALGSNAKRDGR